jgi:hypothetical protein
VLIVRTLSVSQTLLLLAATPVLGPLSLLAPSPSGKAAAAVLLLLSAVPRVGHTDSRLLKLPLLLLCCSCVELFPRLRRPLLLWVVRVLVLSL